MSITDPLHLWLPDAERTQFSGESLAHTLYTFPTDILLIGELGAGKTTFLRGLAQGLGIAETIISPTFALEQRYRTANQREFIHIDCYRLSDAQAAMLLHASEDHTSVRCIEWADRLQHSQDGPRIQIHLREARDGRMLDVTFEDCPLPSDAAIAQWRTEVRLPANVIAHCETVATVCDALSADLLDRGILHRPKMLRIAAQLHDLLRFVDFQPNAQPDGVKHTKSDEECWGAIRARFPNQTHEGACAAFIEEKGYAALASVIAVHGAHAPAARRDTIEKQLLFYADKRVAMDRIVSVEERVQDFQERYGPDASAYGNQWGFEALAIEKKFFPDGAPI